MAFARELTVADASLFAETICSKGRNFQLISQLQCGQQRVYNKRVVLSCMAWNMTMAIFLMLIIDYFCWIWMVQPTGERIFQTWTLSMVLLCGKQFTFFFSFCSVLASSKIEIIKPHSLGKASTWAWGRDQEAGNWLPNQIWRGGRNTLNRWECDLWKSQLLPFISSRYWVKLEEWFTE